MNKPTLTYLGHKLTEVDEVGETIVYRDDAGNVVISIGDNFATVTNVSRLVNALRTALIGDLPRAGDQ